jgi:peptidoglycan biosynthesis protein MviN/MurJ (putative lipid II flippase)
MTARNPFRKYRNKYIDRFLIVTAVALALFSYVLAVYTSGLLFVLRDWALVLIVSTIVAMFAILFLIFAMLYFALSVMYFWRLEKLYERNPRLAVRFFINDYMSPEAKLFRRIFKHFGLS